MEGCAVRRLRPNEERVIKLLQRYVLRKLTSSCAVELQEQQVTCSVIYLSEDQFSLRIEDNMD